MIFYRNSLRPPSLSASYFQMPNLESTNLQTEADLTGTFPGTDLICTFPEPALAQLLQIAEDVTLRSRAGKLSSKFNINKEKTVQALSIKLPIYVHQLKRHKPTAWSEAVVGMVQDTPPEARKGSGEKQFNGSYAKLVSENWMEQKDEFKGKV